MTELILLLLILSILAWLGALQRWPVKKWIFCLFFGALVSVVLFFASLQGSMDPLLPVILTACFTMALVVLVTWLGFFRFILKRQHMRFLYHGAFLIFLTGISVLFPFRAIWSSHEAPEKVQELVNAHQDIAESFGLQKLDISILSGKFPMARVSSFSGNSASIVLSQGLNDMLEPEEMRFVIAHELTHHKFKHYPVRMALFAVAMSLYFFIIWFLMRRKDVPSESKSSGEDEIELFLRRTPLYLLVILLVSLGPLGYCRTQETKADLHAAKVTGSAEAGRSALEKVARTVPDRRHNLFEFLSPHPGLEKRIERLR